MVHKQIIPKHQGHTGVGCLASNLLCAATNLYTNKLGLVKEAGPLCTGEKELLTAADVATIGRRA